MQAAWVRGCTVMFEAAFLESTVHYASIFFLTSWPLRFHEESVISCLEFV
jgi:hypothetical protein